MLPTCCVKWLPVFCVIATVLFSCAVEQPMMGTVFDGRDKAFDFELSNQYGQKVSLADFRGQIVVLTFVYTSCSDTCPIVTSHLKKLYDMLGEQVEGVVFLAVSVDPKRDTVERAYEYSEQWDMLDKWNLLVGDSETLKSIWKEYYIDPVLSQNNNALLSGKKLSNTRNDVVSGLQQKVIAKYDILHSTPVYLIDDQGVLRVLFTLPFDPESVSNDIRLMLD